MAAADGKPQDKDASPTQPQVHPAGTVMQRQSHLHTVDTFMKPT